MTVAPQALLKDALKRLAMKNDRVRQIMEDSKASRYLALFMELPSRHKAQLVETWRAAESQFGQDLFVLSELDFKTDGYFVEFGATNGIEFSNTYLLETRFGWTGILSEPARVWHEDLKRNRHCHIDTHCVWRESGSALAFNETNSGVLSTIDVFSRSDHNAESRSKGRTYSVNSISLLDLLHKYNAPSIIDYLSIDTEGSEFDILSNFDFNRYQFRVITCEHNFAPQRERICSLLKEHGYMRKFEMVSDVDDWYVRAGQP